MNQCRWLCIRRLKASGALQPGANVTGRFSGDLSFEFDTYDSRLALSVTNGQYQPARTHLRFIRIRTHPRPFGGSQSYFECPDCNRLCTRLYFFHGYFSCRRCHRLPYASQRMRAFDRLLEKGRKAEAILSGWSTEECTGFDVPCRPKGMHRSTYRRLIRPIEAAERAFDFETIRRFGRTG